MLIDGVGRSSQSQLASTLTPLEVCRVGIIKDSRQERHSSLVNSLQIHAFE